jgi:hypothetical protein
MYESAMPGKLTLSIDEDLIVFAHAFSQKNGTSISALVERYLARLRGETVSGEWAPKELNLHPKTRALLGAFKDAPIPDKGNTRQLIVDNVRKVIYNQPSARMKQAS